MGVSCMRFSEFLGHNFVSGLRTLKSKKPKKKQKPKNLKKPKNLNFFLKT